MRLQAEHQFDATPDAVVSALLDPEFAPLLSDLPDVGRVEVVDASGDDHGSEASLAVRLVYDGSLDGIAAKVLGSSAPSWVQTYRFDRLAHTGTLTIEPDAHRGLIDCAARISVVAHGAGARREVDGHLTVKVPLIGGRAERALGPAILARIDAEAGILSRWLAER